MKKTGRPKKPLNPKLPTPEQEVWLKENYKLYNRYRLTQILRIRDKELSAWFKLLGLKKRDCHAVVITDEQAEFIEKNYRKMRHEKIAIRLGLSVITVMGYCRRNGLRKIKTPKERERPQPKEIVLLEPKSKPFVRPRADHSNITQEQRIDRWIKEAVIPNPNSFVPVKCLKDHQMRFVMHNYGTLTAQQMADRLGVGVLSVKLFCQANAIITLPELKGKQKKTA